MAPRRGAGTGVRWHRSPDRHLRCRFGILGRTGRHRAMTSVRVMRPLRVDRRTRTLVIGAWSVAGPIMGSDDVSQPADDSVANRDRLDHNDAVAVLREFLGKGLFVPEPHGEHVPIVLRTALPGRLDR